MLKKTLLTIAVISSLHLSCSEKQEPFVTTGNALALLTIASGGLTLYGIHEDNPAAVAIGFGAFTGTACAAAEHAGIGSPLTWFAEHIVRDAITSNSSINPDLAQAGSWITYMTYLAIAKTNNENLFGVTINFNNED